VNVLPLIAVFLLVLGLFSSSLLKEQSAVELERRSYVGARTAARAAQSERQYKMFEKAKKRAPSPGEPPQERNKNPDTQYHSRRTMYNLVEEGKLNLAPLLGAAPPPLLYETAARLIRLLYGHASFYESRLEYALLDAILEEKDHPLLYTVLRGTNQYDLCKKEGYPPLWDFLRMDAHDAGRPVLFRFASQPLLVALFGSAAAESVMEEEKKKWNEKHRHSALSQKELEGLLGTDPRAQQAVRLLGFHARNRSPKRVAAADDASGIRVRN
jgi:hypothetical protein